MALSIGNVTADERYAAWKRVIERIAHENIAQGWNHYMFRLLRAVFTQNEQLTEEGGFIFQWLTQNYIDAALMLVRRELDLQGGTENLRNLLDDMVGHPEVLTRARYRSQWKKENLADLMANKAFDGFGAVRANDNREEDRIATAVVQADLDQLTADLDALRVYAERTRAHRTPPRGINAVDMTFEALHTSIRDIRRVVARYDVLLRLNTVTNWEPTPQYDTIAPFTFARVDDVDRVSEAIGDEEAP